MASSEIFHCSVVTPERAVLECEAKFVALPAWDGEVGILRGRAPLLCKLGIGRLRIETADGKRTLFVDDSPSVLESARGYGFRWLLAILAPDSRRPAREPGGFPAIRDFSEIPLPD